ncbi:hypothetical protein [Cupriavidus pauculus]|uniref:DUF2486 family protein n=1 Tax=Cupriavidus pauculus TaxID=82633 RepID=A0A2N5CGV9_9BURK|nr:hypothetical protein [Cupriavidus pauculus]PLQ01476.1 hypothetical protein CYJ10_07290 [Cupriavidus pauculus]
MSERTTSRVIPRLGPNDSVPLLTEIVELPDAAFEAPTQPLEQSVDQPQDQPLAQPLPARHGATVFDTADMPDSGVVTAVGDTDSLADAATAADTQPPMVDAAAFLPGEDDLRAVRTELLTRVMMRFRTEWPQVVEAHTEATLQSRLAPLTAQLASELTQALEARLVEWLDATLEEIERDPGGV